MSEARLTPSDATHVTIEKLGSGCAVRYKVVGVAESGSRATVIEDYVTFGDGEFLTNAVTELFVEANADVDGVDTEPRCCEGADRRAARHVVARHEDLMCHAGRLARPPERGRCRGRGGVPLVAVDLDRRPGVDDGVVIGIVPIRVVRMDRVCVVSGDAARPGQRSHQRLPIAAAGEHVAFEHPFEQRPTGSGGRRRSDLLVVVEHDHGDVVGRRRGGE